jgi:hypothetical protein
LQDLVVPSEAVGWYLLANYTPVRSDGVFGEAVQVVSTKPVGGLPPKITAIQLSGRFVEGETLKASYEYSGGYEGNSVYGWYLHEVSNHVLYPDWCQGQCFDMLWTCKSNSRKGRSRGSGRKNGKSSIGVHVAVFGFVSCSSVLATGLDF